MKRIFSLFLALVMVLLCFAGCSDETTNNDISTENNEGETSLLDENEFSDNSDDEVDVSVNEGEFDPLSIVKEEYITYDKGDTCHYYNGGGSPKLVFPENFEVEILPGLYLKRSSSNLTVYSNILNVISDNQLLGSIEYYFVGETLKYNDINKLSEGDVIKLMFREDDKSNDLNDNLVANGFSMVEIPMYITVPNLGELFTINDTITEEDLNSLQYIVAVYTDNCYDFSFRNHYRRTGLLGVWDILLPFEQMNLCMVSCGSLLLGKSSFGFSRFVVRLP